ncbi:MAG: superoxide dismutase [Candidatus Aenigmarchaeota archaeon]|nr:superoxide dismutase [Candidatus Aenigmarchaeota archaeon]
MKFELPKLPYSYDALEPHIDAKTMEIHHTKHHQAYVNGLNAALDNPLLQATGTLEEILADISAVPENIRGAVNFHGGGHDNHSIFWNNMSPAGGGKPGGAIGDAIDKAFGGFDQFKERFTKGSMGIQGSGWGWLVLSPKTGMIDFVTMPNQTSPRTAGLVPLLGLDMWEHAFYILRQNRKNEYVDAWWNVVNWDDVESRLRSV